MSVRDGTATYECDTCGGKEWVFMDKYGDKKIPAGWRHDGTDKHLCKKCIEKHQDRMEFLRGR